jgi:hypothetical protein
VPIRPYQVASVALNPPKVCVQKLLCSSMLDGIAGFSRLTEKNKT